MDFVSIRIITGDINRLVGFYEKATGVQAKWSTADFAEIQTAHATLAIGSNRTLPLFAPGAADARDVPVVAGTAWRVLEEACGAAAMRLARLRAEPVTVAPV